MSKRLKPHPETVSTGLYNYLRRPPKMFKDYVVSGNQSSQSRIAGKDISSRVFSTGDRNGGYSAEVSRNRKGKR